MKSLEDPGLQLEQKAAALREEANQAADALCAAEAELQQLHAESPAKPEDGPQALVLRLSAEGRLDEPIAAVQQLQAESSAQRKCRLRHAARARAVPWRRLLRPQLPQMPGVGFV